jgi:hypothetical protein
MYRNPCGFADELVVGGLVGVLKASPATDIINEDYSIGWSSDHISQKLLKTPSTAKNKAALRGIRICADDLETSGLRVLLGRGGLVFERILLMFG